MCGVPETLYTMTRGSSVAYQVVGDGPTDLVFAGGLVTHLDLQWGFPEAERYLRRLASFCRLILFDRRGTGISDRIAESEAGSPAAWVEDLTAVLDAVGSPSAALFAERDAGPAALLFAAMHPERVTALILANTTARYVRADDYPSGETPELAEMAYQAILAEWGTDTLVETTLPSHATDANFIRLATQLQRAAKPGGSPAARPTASRAAAWWWGADIVAGRGGPPAAEAGSPEDDDGEPIAMGFGDVKLAAVLGALLGVPGFLVGLLLAVVLGAVPGRLAVRAVRAVPRPRRPPRVGVRRPTDRLVPGPARRLIPSSLARPVGARPPSPAAGARRAPLRSPP